MPQDLHSGKSQISKAVLNFAKKRLNADKVAEFGSKSAKDINEFLALHEQGLSNEEIKENMDAMTKDQQIGD